jgi:hypothetical protein
LETHTESHDVVVGATAYFLPEQQEDAFGENVTKKGFFPVAVAVRNDGVEKVSLRVESATLESADGKAQGWHIMYQAFKTDTGEAFMVGGLIGSTSSELANDDMANDWREKQFPEQRVIPANGGTRSGFLYFLVKKRGKRPYRLRLTLDRLQSEEPVQLELRLK